MKKFLFIVLSLIISLNIYGQEAPFLYQSPGETLPSKAQFFLTEKAFTRLETRYISHVSKCWQNAEMYNSQLNQDVLSIQGMSGAKNRHFLNNLCMMKNTKYLEIGCSKGATFISALYMNEKSIKSATALDDWTQNRDLLNEFKSKCKVFLSGILFNVFSHDCFSVPTKNFLRGKINTYFYNGPPTAEDHCNAFVFFNQAFADLFIAVIEDWNEEHVRVGTFEAFDSLGYQVLFEVSLPADSSGDLANWSNGVYAAVIKKND